MTGIFSEANLKFGSILVTAIVGIGGILLNLHEMQRTMALEARRPFLEKQLETCFAATDAAARIAARLDGAVDGERPIDTFRRLYLGGLALVENEEVACDMTRFARALRAGRGDLVAKDPIGEFAADCPDRPASSPDAAVQNAALDIAESCRELILTSWGADLPKEVRFRSDP